MLDRECDCSGYEFIDGVPSVLNKMLRDGLIDVSPSSSIEYLRDKKKYDIIEGHSISSAGPVGSIILFSKNSIEALGGQTVLTSSQSETSVALLEIIFKKFIKIKCNLKPADLRLRASDFSLPDAGAFLLIGDDALKTVKRESKNSHHLYSYDLGEVWHKNTGLPFTIAMRINPEGLRRTEKAELLAQFKNDLDKAKSLALKNLKKIAAESPLRNTLTEQELISYWEKQVSYDFGDEHKKGLELFRKYSEELGLI